MAERERRPERRPTYGIGHDEAEQATSEHDDAYAVPGPRMVYAGAIPPPEEEWVDADKRPPSASELAYGDVRGNKPARQAIGPGTGQVSAASWVEADKRPPTASERFYGDARGNKPSRQAIAPGARQGQRGETSQRPAPTSKTTHVEMEEEFVGKPDVQMADDYVGTPLPGGDHRNKGLVCERPDAAGFCTLTATQRQMFLIDFTRYVPMAATAFHAALQNARMDELLKKAPPLGLAAELLIGAFGVITGTLLNGAAGLAIAALAKREVASGVMPAADMTSIVAARSTHARTVLAEMLGITKGRVKLNLAANTPQSQIKTALIEHIQAEVNPRLNAAAEWVLDNGDDVALVLATEAFNPNVFNMDACKGHIDDLVKRLEAQHLDDIGSIKVGAVPDAGTTEVVRLQSWGKQRLAVIKFYEAKKMGRMYGDDWYTPSGTEFVSWVDDDFGDFATGVQEARNGSTKTIDVSMGHGFGSDVQGWVERTTKGASR